MRCLWAIIRLQLKRSLSQRALLACLLLMPLLSGLMAAFIPRAPVEPTLKIGILLPGRSRESDRLWERLRASSDDRTQFILAQSEEEVLDRVASRTWECGYVFARDFDAKIGRGDYRDLVIRVMSPASMTLFTSWTIFSALFEVCAPHLILDFLNQNHLSNDRNIESVMSEWVAAGSSGFEKLRVKSWESVGRDFDSKPVRWTGAAEMTRGLTALLLFVFAYLWSIQFLDDRLSGFFYRVRSFEPAFRSLAGYLAAAGLLMAAGGGMAVVIERLCMPGSVINPGQEALLLVVFILSLAAFSFLLSLVLPERNRLMALLPFFMILTLLLSPIFFDAGRWIRQIRWLADLIPTTHYLRAVRGGRRAIVSLIRYTGILVMLSAGIGYMKVRLAGKPL